MVQMKDIVGSGDEKHLKAFISHMVQMKVAVVFTESTPNL